MSHNGISVCGMKRSGYAAHHSSSIQSFHACDAREREVLVVGFEEPVAAEARERREQQLGPHAVFVHRAHALVDVVRGRDHVVVAAGEQVVALARFAVAELAGVRVALELQRIEAALPLPALHAGFGLDDARRLVAVARRDVVDEHVRRFDHVVVDRDQLRVRGEHEAQFTVRPSAHVVWSRRPAEDKLARCCSLALCPHRPRSAADAGAVHAYAQRVEELGYAHVVAYDHVVGADPTVHAGWRGPVQRPVHLSRADGALRLRRCPHRTRSS